jgi:mannose-6-phosphate isomerase-like protein (cupin superfamily)
MTTLSNQPYALARDEGTAIWFLGTLVVMKATSEQTGGAFGLIENLMPADFAGPYHVHHAEDEAFWVLEGTVTFVCGNQTVTGGPGTFVYGPRDVPHGLRAEGTTPARILLQNLPGGFEHFFRDMGEPAQALTLPPPGPIDMEKLVALGRKYHFEILGPLPL